MADEFNSESTENTSENQEQQTPAFVVREVTESDNNSVVENVFEQNSNESTENSNENEVIQDNQNQNEDNDNENYYEELDEELAFNYLKEKKGLDAESLDDLLASKKGKKLTPEVEKFLEFQEKTGNTNYNDFLATQKDWKAEDPNNVLREMLRIENPTLTDKEIDFLFKENYTFDEEYAEESEQMRKGIRQKTDLQKAYDLLEKRKEEYMVHRGSDELIPEDYKQAKTIVEKLQQEQLANEKFFEDRRNEFVHLTDSVFTDKFEGFKTKIGNQEFVIKPENLQETKNAQMDISNIQRKFFDNNDKLIDPEGYHKALYFANNADKVAEHYFNLGKAHFAEEQERLSKNIPGQGIRQVDTSKGTQKFVVREVKD